MRDACYVVADEFGIVRMTKRQPSLKRGERGVKEDETLAVRRSLDALALRREVRPPIAPEGYVLGGDDEAR